MAYLFAQNLKRILYIQDTTSNISSRFHLIFDTFIAPPSTFFTEKRGIPVSVERGHQLNMYISSLSRKSVCEKAKTIFKFKPEVLTRLKDSVAHLPPIDIGIHIRTGDKITSGEMGAIPIQTYIEALRRAKQKDTMNVYVMTDNPCILEQLKGGLDESFHLFMLEHPILISDGHDQKTYNSLDSKKKLEAFYHFLSEMYILQRAPICICTYSSNIGRFIYMTSEFQEGIQSLDISEFNLLQHVPGA